MKTIKVLEEKDLMDGAQLLLEKQGLRVVEMGRLVVREIETQPPTVVVTLEGVVVEDAPRRRRKAEAAQPEAEGADGAAS